MCRYNIHCSLEQVHDLIRRRNPKDLTKLLNDIRWEQCAHPAPRTSKGFCKAITFKDVRIVSDLKTCPGCRQGHHDGLHISKGDFSKTIGTQAFDWLRKLGEEVKQKHKDKEGAKLREEAAPQHYEETAPDPRERKKARN